jgi:hypothetical protein
MKEKKWKISSRQKKLLDSLFEKIKNSEIKSVLDMGAGRTSVHYLANRFKNIKIKAVVYPGDERKIKPILECVPEKNYEIIENDIKNLKIKKVDLILAHLFLGEAEKFAGNKFEDILKRLFAIKTKYLVIVNVERDSINYWLLFKHIANNGIVLKISYVNRPDKEGDICLGFTIKKMEKIKDLSGRSLS